VASERAKPAVGTHEQEHRIARSHRVASGTLACPRCDAPVALNAAVSPADRLDCPFCLHRAPVRDFLSLGEPTRPARVEVRVRAAW
jgi:hypothetical protein